MFQFSKKSISMISGFNNLALVLTIKDVSDLIIYVYIHFSQSGLRKLMFSIFYLKNCWNSDSEFESFTIYEYDFLWFLKMSTRASFTLTHLFGAKPLPEPTLAYCHCWTLKNKFQSNLNQIQTFHWRKCLLRNGGHFVRGEMSYGCSLFAQVVVCFCFLSKMYR